MNKEEEIEMYKQLSEIENMGLITTTSEKFAFRMGYVSGLRNGKQNPHK